MLSPPPSVITAGKHSQSPIPDSPRSRLRKNSSSPFPLSPYNTQRYAVLQSPALSNTIKYGDKIRLYAESPYVEEAGQPKEGGFAGYYYRFRKGVKSEVSVALDFGKIHFCSSTHQSAPLNPAPHNPTHSQPLQPHDNRRATSSMARKLSTRSCPPRDLSNRICTTNLTFTLSTLLV